MGLGCNKNCINTVKSVCVICIMKTKNFVCTKCGTDLTDSDYDDLCKSCNDMDEAFPGCIEAHDDPSKEQS